ncbi:MAG TPA: hypothetical protein VIY48_16795 [Candidatus Paceibacterota bacterium]
MLRLLLVLTCITLSLPAFAAQPKNVAIMVYSQSKLAAQYARIALSRFEQVLTDNGVTVLDQKKADALKKGWKKLEDPGALITAEEFVKNAGKYAIDGVYRVYLDAGITTGLAGIYTATALADIRFVGEDAAISSAASPAMGAKGMPPSDGLTESAALSNAIQRAVDLTAQQLGWKVMDFTNPRLYSVHLKQMQMVPAYVAEAHPPKLANSDDSVKLAKLANEDWTTEEATCVRKSPDERMAVVGGYIRQTSLLGGRPKRVYGSRVHVVDASANKEVVTLETAPVAERTREEKGGSKILDCLFVSNWRYLAAVTNSKLFLWDTERGVVLSDLYLDDAIEDAALEYGKYAGQDYLAVVTGSRKLVYQIVRE